MISLSTRQVLGSSLADRDQSRSLSNDLANLRQAMRKRGRLVAWRSDSCSLGSLKPRVSAYLTRCAVEPRLQTVYPPLMERRVRKLTTAVLRRLGFGASAHDNHVSPTIPRNDQYPVSYRHGQNVPAVLPSAILTFHRTLIGQVEEHSPLAGELHHQVVSPVIAQFAAYVHLLPASRCSHHAGLGGFFCCGIKAMRTAAVLSKSSEFAYDTPFDTRAAAEARWRVCAMIATLARCLTLLTETTGAMTLDGKRWWVPHRQGLFDWLEQNELSEYRWNPFSPARHACSGTLALSQIHRLVPQQTYDWLTVDGQDHVEAMFDAVAGMAERRNPLANVVDEAITHVAVLDALRLGSDRTPEAWTWRHVWRPPQGTDEQREAMYREQARRYAAARFG